MIASAGVVARECRAATAEPAAVAVPSRSTVSGPARYRPLDVDHSGQVGLAVMPGMGYRVLARYNDRQFCLDHSQDDSKWVCTRDAPLFLDLALSYGLGSRVDLMTEVRLGLARDRVLGVGRQFALFPGVRFWLDRNQRVKFYTTVQAVIDHTEQGQDRVRDTDFGLRNANGLMYDPIRNLGFFVQIGETLGFVRWFRIEVDAGLGVQVRFP